MLGRAVAVTLALFLFAGAAFSQCDFTPRYSGQYRTSILDLAIEMNDLWVATSYGVQLLDRSVTPPRPVASIAVPGITRVVRVIGGNVYAGSGSTVFVLRRNGASINIVGSADAGATINDLLVLSGYLYAATSSGAVQFDLSDAAHPAKTSAQFATSPSTIGLASRGTTLYVADSDSTVEVFSVASPPSPQKTGSLSSLPRSESIAVANNRLYVSDGQSTDVFLTIGTSLTNVATVPFGSTSFATLAGDVAFVAGSDRHLRAVDFSTPGSVARLFEAEIAATGGTVNRISAVQVADGRLYAAAGDAGLLVYDISGFTPPYPVQAVGSGPTTTVISTGNKFYASSALGGLVEYTRSSNGQLTLSRSWDGSRLSAVHEVTTSGFLLTSSDRTLIYWTLAATTPVSISSAVFRQPITSAVLVGTRAYVVLEDRSLWTADMALLSPAPQQIPTPGVNPSFITRSGSSFAISDLRSDGTTSIAFYPSADFNTPRLASIEGVANGGLTLSGTTAAAFAFRGISIINFAATPASVSILPGSNIGFVSSLILRGTTLISVEDNTLSVWDTATQRRLRRLTLPSQGVAVHIADGQTTYADVATNDGVAAVAFNSSSQSPALRSTTPGNRYYREAAAVADRLYLFDGQTVDIFSTAFGAAPHYVMTIRTPGIAGFAVSTGNVFVLTTSGVLLAYTRDGAPLKQVTLTEGPTTDLLGVEVVGGAPWVAISRGCPTACEKETIVLDPVSLVSTAKLSGEVTNVVTSGTRAYALFDLPNSVPPNSVRIFNVADPLHPAPIVDRVTEGSRPPVSIAAANGIVYVLGDQLYAYSEATLMNVGTQFQPYATDVTSSVVYVDQRLVVEGACAFVSGRTFAPQFFNVASPAQWSPLSSFPSPATVKSVASTSGRIFLLTDYSIEILSTTAQPAFPRRRAVR